MIPRRKDDTFQPITGTPRKCFACLNPATRFRFSADRPKNNMKRTGVDKSSRRPVCYVH